MEKVIAIYREVNNPVTGFNQSLAAKTFTDRRSANNTGNGFNLVETTEDLAGINLPSGELVKLHNLYAKKPVNKFSDKATAVKRTFGVLSDLPTSNKPVSNVEKEMELYREKVPSFGPKVSKPRGAFGGKKIKCLVQILVKKALVLGTTSACSWVMAQSHTKSLLSLLKGMVALKVVAEKILLMILKKAEWNLSMPRVVKEVEGFVIESGVPLFDPDKSKDRWVRLINAMKFKDSTILKTSGDVVSFRMACKRLGFNCKSRAIRDKEGKATSNVRVWKVEK